MDRQKLRDKMDIHKKSVSLMHETAAKALDLAEEYSVAGLDGLANDMLGLWKTMMIGEVTFEMMMSVLETPEEPNEITLVTGGGAPPGP